jgi:hypothetical protein
MGDKHKQGGIRAEVWKERDRQEAEEGYTPEHDDQHTPADWFDFILDYAARARGRGARRGRRAAVQIGALALAMIESLDRKAAGGAPEAPEVPAQPGWYMLEAADQAPPVIEFLSARVNLGGEVLTIIPEGRAVYLEAADLPALSARMPILRWRPAAAQEGWDQTAETPPEADGPESRRIGRPQRLRRRGIKASDLE